MYIPGTRWSDGIHGRPALVGTADPDDIFGYGGNDHIFGNGGDDYIVGGPGADRIEGGQGSDTASYEDSPLGVSVTLSWLGGATGRGFLGTAEGDTLSRIENLNGSSHNDILIGNDQENVLSGQFGDDSLFGSGGDDQLFGGIGRDVLSGGAGADHLDGGRDIDTADYSDSPDRVLVNLEFGGLGVGGGQYGDAEGDTLVDIENVVGSEYNDFILGDVEANSLYGLAGRDTLLGFGGDDFLYGGRGDDILVGGDGADFLNGGRDGSDTAAYVDSLEGVQVNLEVGLGFSGTALGDVLVDVENLLGSLHDDVLVGDDAANVFEGALGDDYLIGGGGNDHLFGGLLPLTAADIGDGEIVHLPDGHDTLIGGRGADELTGGTNADRLTGGRDADTFVWTSMDETGVTFETMDFITDFNRREGDRIDLRAIDANPFPSAPGDQAFTFIGTDAFSFRATPSGEVPPGLIRYYSDGTDTFIALNSNALPDDNAVIRVHGVHTVDASWFLP